MKKVIFLAPISSNAGGIAVWLKNVISFCNMNCIAYDVIDTFREQKQTLVNRFIKPFLKLHSQKAKLIKEYKKNKNIILHVASSGSFGLFRDLSLIKKAQRLSIPVIFHIHFGRVPQVFDKKNWEYLLLKKCFALSSKIVAIDPYTFSVIKENDKARFIVNPVITKKYSYNSKSKKYIFVGHVRKEKGIYELLDCFKNISDSRDIDLNIVGKSFIKNFQTLIATENRVHYFGELEHEQVFEMIAQSRCLILPSYSEGMPNVILEAMSLGIPCIATDVGANKFLIDKCGYLIKSRDIYELEEAVIKSLNNQNDEFSKISFKRINANFSLDVVGQSYLNLWREL